MDNNVEYRKMQGKKEKKNEELQKQIDKGEEKILKMGDLNGRFGNYNKGIKKIIKIK